MFLYIITLFSLFMFSVLYKINTHLILKEYMYIKYNKWKKLKSLISTTESNKYKIIIASMNIVMKTLYISFIQYMNNSVHNLDRKTFELKYVIEGKLYKMLIVPTRGPAPVLQVSNENSIDVTDEILPYMGPKYNWHNNKMKPSFFAYDSLTFQLMDGTEKTYNRDDIIELKIK